MRFAYVSQPSTFGNRGLLAPRRVNMGHMDDCAPPPGPPVSNTSGRSVFCVKYQKDLPGLDAPPWPGELGQRIYEQVSAQAWKLWEERQKMILNEYRLMPWQKEAQDLIAKQLEDFFFGQGAALPPGYVPQQTK
jgi:Fe-S cluster biosynthesis and repair protein YggX